MPLSGRAAIVTGAARGIGRAIAQRLADDGARVTVVDLDPTIAAVAAELGGPQVADAVCCDVSKRLDCDAMFDRALERFGTVDVLVNNAGINRDGMLHKMADEQWDAVLATDLTAVFYTTRRAAQHMRERRYGRIVNISSASWQGSLGQANYAAAKAGVVGLTLTAARELAAKGVTANVVCPGFIDTSMTRKLPPAIWDQVISRIPVGAAGRPQDVASLIGYLASDAAGYLTGQVFNVNGGLIW